ncbi:hypothetical protein ACVW0P_004135, partial [Mucilaginibacter sp. UYNi724]
QKSSNIFGECLSFFINVCVIKNSQPISGLLKENLIRLFRLFFTLD